MNFFENEMRKLFADDAVFDNTVFVGRVCLGDVGNNLRARVEFVCPEKWDRYSAFRITILNRTTGPVDSTEISFRDIWGAEVRHGMGRLNNNAPYLWDCDNKVRWFPSAPGDEEYDCLRNAVRDYVQIFRSPQERNERASLEDKIRIAAICVVGSGQDESNKVKDFETVR